jgi:acetylornithine/succinyldiaminopimelate/putrescine aminotransferase
MKSEDSTERGRGRHLKPRLQELLGVLRMDVSYERGAGNHLYYRDKEGREVAVLDMLGGYGSLLLGHGHPELVAEAGRLLATGRPAHAQASRREMAMRLARELSERAGGDYCVVFGNSGAESVEAAMKHAMLETGGRTFIALEGAFHGKTLGALQLTSSEVYRGPFELTGIRVLRVAVDDREGLERAFGEAEDLAGFVFEPVLGEGGIRPVSGWFAGLAAERCAERGVPLIADESQSGMGRTGKFLASEWLGVKPDYIVLSKALGGGLAKLSALLVDRRRYRDEFDLLHTSTYAEDDFSCGIGLAVLRLVDGVLMGNCERMGERLMAGLRRLREKHGGVIGEVRGRGLMVAVTFLRRPRAGSFVLRSLDAQEELVAVVAGYLLRVHRIRVAPTLSDPYALRIEPAVLLENGDADRFLAALDDVCHRLEADDGLGLTRYVLTEETEGPGVAGTVRERRRFSAYDPDGFGILVRRPAGVRAGWLCHLTHADDMLAAEPSFGALTVEERERYLAQWVPRVAPVLMGAKDVRAAGGEVVRIHPILLPVTARWMKAMIEARHPVLPQALVQAGVDFAKELGCGVVSLGQYTSIATMNGLRTAAHGMGVTTGNSYALALALEAVARAMEERGMEPGETVLVVAGAAGNIGRTCAEMLAPGFRRTILLGSGRAGSAARLGVLAGRLPRATVAGDSRVIGEAGVVIAATSAVDAPLDAGRFASGAVVCDLSVPTAIGGGGVARGDVRVIRGGIARLPCGEDVGFPGFPLGVGRTYGCMAEAMVLALEGVRSTRFTGRLTASHVRDIEVMARRHGFGLADGMGSEEARHLDVNVEGLGYGR